MSNEQASNQDTVEAQVAAEQLSDASLDAETPEQLTPFVYPSEYKTEFGREIRLRRPVGTVEIEFGAKLGEIAQIIPGLNDFLGPLAEATKPDGTAEVSPDDPAVGSVNELVATVASEAPRKLFELVAVLVEDMSAEELADEISLFHDGVILLTYFIMKQANRFGLVAENLRETVGINMPKTLSQAAAQMSEQGTSRGMAAIDGDFDVEGDMGSSGPVEVDA